MAKLQQKNTADTQKAMDGFMESESASMTVKVRLERESGDNEIRRFLVAGDVNYNKLKNKIGKMFPSCPADFNVSWTDSDGDNIVISSNEELQLALSNRTDDIMRLKIKGNINYEENIHPGHRVHAQTERLMALEHATMHHMQSHARPCVLKKQGGQPMAPFPCWSGMMTRIWQNRAKQLWIETSSKPVSKEMEQNVMNRWMVTMGNAWKELVGKQPDHQSKRRWREAVINCCNRLKNSSEEKSLPEDRSEQMLEKDTQSGDDTSGAEGGKQEDMKEKRTMWRRTMRQCWKQADKQGSKKVKGGDAGPVKDQESGTEYKKQWRQMMRQMMHGNCPTSRDEMKEKKELLKKWWRKQQKKNDKDKTSGSSSNESLDSDVDADYIHVSVDNDTDINMKDCEPSEPPSEENIHHPPLTRQTPATMVFKSTCDDAPQLRSPAEADTVAQAVEQLKVMGFSDEGGWLTRLTQAKQADVNKVLDSLKPAQQ